MSDDWLDEILNKVLAVGAAGQLAKVLDPKELMTAPHYCEAKAAIEQLVAGEVLEARIDERKQVLLEANPVTDDPDSAYIYYSNFKERIAELRSLETEGRNTANTTEETDNE